MALQQRTIVDDFESIVMSLIAEAARYAAEGPGPGGTVADAEGNIRRLRVLSAALSTAVASIPMGMPIMQVGGPDGPGGPPPEAQTGG